MATSWISKNKIPTLLIAAAVVFIAIKWQGNAKTAEGELSEPIKKGVITESVYGIGTVTANKTFQFKPGTTNTLHNIFVKEGDTVKRGDRLVELDGGLIVSAPFDGTVTSLPFKVGENVFAQSVIVDLVDLLDRYLLVSLEQRGALRVRRGQSASLSFDGMRDQAFEGKVDSIYSSGNNFLVRINISNLSPQILPGMTADTAIAIEERKDVLLIPVAALDNGKVTVQRAVGKNTVAVTTGIIDGAMAEVTAGDLKEGDRLLIRKGFKK